MLIFCHIYFVKKLKITENVKILLCYPISLPCTSGTTTLLKLVHIIPMYILYVYNCKCAHSNAHKQYIALFFML